MFRKLLRLFVMMSIRTPEEVYRISAKSVGLDTKNMSANEVSAWKASMKSIEADYMIHAAFNDGIPLKKELQKVCDTLSKQINTKNSDEAILKYQEN